MHRHLRVPLTAANERLPSGVLYALDPGLAPTVKDLLKLMIIIGDNEATDALADKVGRANVTAYAHSLWLMNTAIEFADLDWDRAWLGSLDPSHRHASGGQTVNFSLRSTFNDIKVSYIVPPHPAEEVSSSVLEVLWNLGTFDGCSRRNRSQLASER